MAKPKVSFKPVRIAEGDWNILAEFPGVRPVRQRLTDSEFAALLPQNRSKTLRITGIWFRAFRSKPLPQISRCRVPHPIANAPRRNGAIERSVGCDCFLI